MENRIINPEKLKRLLSKKSYWGKGLVLSHWVQSTSFNQESIINVFVELNNEGFFINSYLIFDWNIPFVYDEEIFCFKENVSYVFSDKYILIRFKDGLQATIIIGLSNDLAALGVIIHKKHLINRLSEELPYWEKEIECFVRNNDVKKSNTLLVNETGLYLNGIQKVAWKDYLLYELYPNVLQLMHDDTLLYWGSKETGFSPRKEHLVDFKDNVIICCGEYIYIEDTEKIVFESLKNALKRNLEEQERTNGNIIRTEISCNSFFGEIEVVNPITKTLANIPKERFSRCSMRVMPTYERTASNQNSLLLCVRFYEITDKIALLKDDSESSYANFNKKNKSAHERFKSLNISKRFAVQTDTLVLVYQLGYGRDSGKVYQYFIDFGQNIDDAAEFLVQYFKDYKKVDILENFKLNFKLETVNLSEHKAIITKAKNKSQNLRIISVVFFALLALLLLFALFTDDESVVQNLLGLLSTVLVLFYTSRGGD